MSELVLGLCPEPCVSWVWDVCLNDDWSWGYVPVHESVTMLPITTAMRATQVTRSTDRRMHAWGLHRSP